MQRQSGYTISELLIAIGVAGLLLAIAVPLYNQYQGSAKNAAVLAHLTEIEEPLVTYVRTHEPLDICQDYTAAVNLPDMSNPEVGLQLTFSPVDEKDASQGYRASVVVSADPGQDIQAAMNVHDSMKARDRVADGDVVTESFVAFEVFMTPADDPFCKAMSTTPTMAASSSGSAQSSSGVSAPSISFSFTTEQDVVEFGTSGTGSVINNGPLQSGGDMTQLAVEFNVIGGEQVATQGIHGATFLSYGVQGNENEFYVWKPSDLTVRVHGTEYATGIDTTADGETHRYTVLWSSDTGRLQVLVDGEVRFTRDNVANGYAIPGGGVLTLAQDQDRFQIEDGTQGDNHGFSPSDAFHGQIFSASMASRVPDATALENAPLASVIDASNGLITNIQMENGQVTDVTGKHALTIHGDVTRRTVSVDTSVAVPNPGATLSLKVNAAAQGDDTLIGLKLVGLLPGTSVTDAIGNTGNGASIDILGWDLASITAKLPPGVAENMNIGVIATAKGRRGDLATAAQYEPLVLDPLQPVPPRTN